MHIKLRNRNHYYEVIKSNQGRMAYDWLNYARLYFMTSNYSKINFLLLYDFIAIVQLNIWYLRYFKFVYFRKPVLRPNPRYWWTVLDYMLQNRRSFITRKCKYDRRLKYRNLQCMRQSFYQLSKLLHYYFGGNDQSFSMHYRASGRELTLSARDWIAFHGLKWLFQYKNTTGQTIL